MRISLIGEFPYDEQRRVTHELAKWALRETLPDHYKKTNVRVVVGGHVDGLGLHGECHCRDGRNATKFDILLSERDMRENFLCHCDTLAHEIWHIRQMVLGELYRDHGIDVWEWRGGTYPTEGLPLYRQPWEVEAMGVARMLVDRYVINDVLAHRWWYKRPPEYERMVPQWR